MDNFATKLAEYLRNSGMTQRQLAEAAGVTEAAMSKYLSGERTPRAVTVGAIAKALGIPVAALFGESPAKEESVPSAIAVIARNAGSLTDDQKRILFDIIANLKD